MHFGQPNNQLLSLNYSISCLSTHAEGHPTVIRLAESYSIMKEPKQRKLISVMSCKVLFSTAMN